MADRSIIFDETFGRNNRIVFRRKDKKAFEFVHYSKINGEWVEGKVHVTCVGMTVGRALCDGADYFDWFSDFALILISLNWYKSLHKEEKSDELQKQTRIPKNKFNKYFRILIQSGLIETHHDMKEKSYSISKEGIEFLDCAVIKGLILMHPDKGYYLITKHKIK